MQNTVKPTGFSITENIILTCVCIPDICHPVLATREDKVPTWCESTIDPLSVVCGSGVLLHSQAERGKLLIVERKYGTVTTAVLVRCHQFLINFEVILRNSILQKIQHHCCNLFCQTQKW